MQALFLKMCCFLPNLRGKLIATCDKKENICLQQQLNALYLKSRQHHEDKLWQILAFVSLLLIKINIWPS